MTDLTPVHIAGEGAVVAGDLVVPARAAGLVIFAHGEGSSRLSPRNGHVMQAIEDGGFATLLMNLPTRDDEARSRGTRESRFEIGRLARRVMAVVDWAREHPKLHHLPIGCFGASTGAAAALIAAADRPEAIRAVIACGGRPDLAGDALGRVIAPTLLIVGGADDEGVALNEGVLRQMHRTVVRLELVPGARHLFEEPAARAQVSRFALQWCRRYLAEE